MTKLLLAPSLLLFVLVVGCASGRLRGKDVAGFNYLDSKITSVAVTQAKPLKYVLQPADEKADPGDIHQQRVAAFVEKALHLARHQRVGDPAQADATIYYAFGIGPHHVTTNYYNGLSSGQSRITHIRRVELKAVGHGKKALWQSSATSLGISSDYSKVIPGLLGGLVPYLGQELAGEQDVRIQMNDRNVEYILGVSHEDGSPVIIQ